MLLRPLPLLWREVSELLPLPQLLLQLRLLEASELLQPPLLLLLLLLPPLEASEGLRLKLHLPAQVSEDLEVKFLLALLAALSSIYLSP